MAAKEDLAQRVAGQCAALESEAPRECYRVSRTRNAQRFSSQSIHTLPKPTFGVSVSTHRNSNTAPSWARVGFRGVPQTTCSKGLRGALNTVTLRSGTHLLRRRWRAACCGCAVRRSAACVSQTKASFASKLLGRRSSRRLALPPARLAVPATPVAPAAPAERPPFPTSPIEIATSARNSS